MINSLPPFYLEGLRNGWQIISPGKSFAVYAATGTEKAEWMAHINKCIDDLVAKSEWLWVFVYLWSHCAELLYPSVRRQNCCPFTLI